MKKQEPAKIPEVASFRMCKLHLESLAEHPGLTNAIVTWMTAKAAAPTSSIGKDTPFIATGPIGNLGLNIRHAHITRDIAICYRVHSKPTLIDLYGVFTHKALGTGNASNIRIQQQMATKFGNQTFK
jgi:hypothetical protein